MIRVKILGAGSIGNHLAHACRDRDWAVTLCDVDAQALRRTREEIYPGRYGAWDETIELKEPQQVEGRRFDVVVVGTPPDYHLPVALAELTSQPPQVLLVEKPLSPPSLAGCDQLRAMARSSGTRVLVGYNHRLTRHTVLAEEWLAEGGLGEPVTLSAFFREHWGGIFAAHPWLRGPSDTYVGFTERGGGALCEHSHALNIWQHFAQVTGQGRIVEVTASLDEVARDGARYDRIAQLSVRTESGLLGTVLQDVVTRPALKWLRLEMQRGYLEWQVNVDAGHDLVRLGLADGSVREERPAKSRPDDFRGEIAHVAALLESRERPSVLDLESGLDTMRVIAAAITSARSGRTVTVDYQAPTPELSC